MENMIPLGGSLFIFDTEVYTEVLTTLSIESNTIETETMTSYDENGVVTGVNVNVREYEKPKEVDAPKYDLLRMCLEVVFTYYEEVDDSLGLERALGDTTIPFKLAFNTLISYGILKEVG